MKEQASSTFCILPWILLYIDNWGNILPCCLSSDEFWNDKNNPFNVSNVDNIEYAWNSAKFKHLRKEMLNGKKPFNCKICFEHERCSNSQSFRLAHNHLFSHLIERSIKSTNADGSIPVEFKAFDFKLGNLCNLKCNMCGPHSSIQILNDLKKADPSFELTSDYKRLNTMDWFRSNDFWNYIKEHLKTVEKIHLTGGETLLVKEVFDFKKYLVESNYSKNIILTLNTNATYLDDSIYALWPKFKRVQLYASVDAIGDLNDYIRFPSNWTQIERNLEKLNNDANMLNVEISIHTTIQIYNIFKITEVITFFSSHFENIRQTPSFFPLETPHCFDVRILSSDVKEKIKKYFDKYLKDYKFFYPKHYMEIKNILDGISNILDHGTCDLEALEELRIRTKSLNFSRGKEISELVPEISSLV